VGEPAVISDQFLLTGVYTDVYNDLKGVRMPNLQRVNLMLDPQQREALERLARQKKRSISDLVREYITTGLHEDNNPQRERQQALENARALSARILKRRQGQPLPDLSQVIDQMRKERDNELLGH
jgi:hypothetical protein